MSTLEPKSGERVKDVRVTDDAISVDLFDGRTITVPLAWYPRLLHATPEERANWCIAGAGTEYTVRTSMRTSPPTASCRPPLLPREGGTA